MMMSITLYKRTSDLYRTVKPRRTSITLNFLDIILMCVYEVPLVAKSSVQNKLDQGEPVIK